MIMRVRDLKVLDRLSPSLVLSVPRKRFYMLPHVIIGVAMAFGAFFDQGSFTSPVFTVVFDWIPLEYWGIIYSVVAVTAILTVLKAWWVTYFVSNTLLLFGSTAWLLTLIDARYFNDLKVSSPAFGLWGFIVAVCLLIAWAPSEVYSPDEDPIDSQLT